jgi:hypothetical protein
MTGAQFVDFIKRNSLEKLEIGILNADDTLSYNVQPVMGTDTQFNNLPICVFTSPRPSQIKRSSFEVVAEDGDGNTWPFKVKRKNESLILGKFKGPYLANLFCEYLEKNYDVDVARAVDFARHILRKNSLL